MKLKHRITGTILMIAFATTTALPAATIPQLKNPPKAVTAPRVPTAVAPRIPVAPKVVKVPVVKVPVIPRVVSVPKVPAVKVPVVKVPVTPRIIAAPKAPVVKTPVKVAAAPRIPAVKSPVTNTSKAPVVVSLPVTSPNLNPKDIRKIVNEALNTPLIKRTPDLAGLPTLPTRSLPGSNKPNLKPTSPGTPSLDGTPSTPTPTINTRPIPALSDSLTAKPVFDNGFGTRPQLTQAELGNALILNPITPNQPGAATGGFLGGTIPVHNGSPFAGGVPNGGAAGSGMISDGIGDQILTVIEYGSAAAGVGASSLGVLSPELIALAGGVGEKAGAVGGVYSAGKAGYAAGTLLNEFITWAQGKSIGDAWADAFLGSDPAPATQPAPSQPSAETSDPENRHGGRHTFGVAVGQQIKQGKSGRKGSVGGGADVMPGHESYTGGTARIPGAAVPQTTNGLVGQPKQGEPENGNGAPPPNTNSDANVTTPTPTDG